MLFVLKKIIRLNPIYIKIIRLNPKDYRLMLFVLKKL